MTKPPNQNRKPESDPYMVANTLGSLMSERNPIQAMVGDITRMISVIANLNKNRQAAQTRIDQLQLQVSKVKDAMSSSTQKPTGNRFDRLR